LTELGSSIRDEDAGASSGSLVGVSMSQMDLEVARRGVFLLQEEMSQRKCIPYWGGLPGLHNILRAFSFARSSASARSCLFPQAISTTQGSSSLGDNRH
jgi:hypothetical protein